MFDRLPGGFYDACEAQTGNIGSLVSGIPTVRTDQRVPVPNHIYNTRNQPKQQKSQCNQMRIDTFGYPKIHIALKSAEPAFSVCVVQCHAVLDPMKYLQSVFGYSLYFICNYQ